MQLNLSPEIKKKALMASGIGQVCIFLFLLALIGKLALYMLVMSPVLWFCAYRNSLQYYCSLVSKDTTEQEPQEVQFFSGEILYNPRYSCHPNNLYYRDELKHF